MGSKCTCFQKEEEDIDERLREERRAARMQQRRLYDPRLRRRKKPIPVEQANALNEAARNNKLDVVKMMVEDQGVFVNVRDKERAWNGYTPLMNACANDHWKLALFLLKKGADPDIGTMHGDTALMVAAGNGHIKTVKLLLGKQYGEANPNLATTTGVTALSKAAFAGHLKIVKMLVEAGADVNQATTPGQTTPLIEASASGRLDVVKYLCSKGADVHVRKEGETALDWAARRDQVPVAQYLKRVDTEREIARSAKLREDSRLAALQEAERERNKVVMTPPKPQKHRKKNPHAPPARKYIRPSRRGME